MLLFQMHQQRDNPWSTMKNHDYMKSQKEINNSPKIKLKIREYCDLTDDRDFKIAVMKKLNELQENSERNLMISGIKLINKGILFQEIGALK